MRTYVKYVILLLLILPSVWLIRLLFLRPFNIDHFFERSFLVYSLESPELLSSLRVLDQYGITNHRSQLDDISEIARDRELRFLKQTEETFRGYDRERLNDQQKLSYDVFAWYLKSLEERTGPWRYYEYPVNQMNGMQSAFPSFMDDVHSVTNKNEARDYVARLRAVGVKWDQLLELLLVQKAKGILPPDFIIDRILKEMQDFVAVPVQQNILFTSLKTKMEKAEFKEKDSEIYLNAADKAIAEIVYPSYRKLIDFFAKSRPEATHDAGVWKLPDGVAYYKYILRTHTSLDLDPEAVHQLGLKEVARIQAEMRPVLRQLGFADNVSIGESLAKIAADPRNYYPDDAGGREQILLDYQAIIDHAGNNLSNYFQAMPKAGVKVERVAAFMEATAPGGSYSDPSMDGERPGVFNTNLLDIKATPKFGMRTLAYHETIPGHHLQVALGLEADLPMFRRIGLFTSFVEGWALYAERLAFEAGFEKDPLDNIGRLQAELFRALRLVIDTGLHAKRWSREQAIDYMQAESGMASSAVIQEVERYVVDPGQACAYMIGMLKFLELRERAQRELGPKFDIKAFHSLVLNSGAMPLSVLDQWVDRWIDQQR